MVPVKTAVVGCGGISDIYFQNMIGKYKNLDVISCCAKHLESAERQGKKYGINAQTYEEILQDPEIEMVVILTPADTHYELIKQGLSAGKHVFTEKPLAVDTMQGLELLKLADQKKCYLLHRRHFLEAQSRQLIKHWKMERLARLRLFMWLQTVILLC